MEDARPSWLLRHPARRLSLRLNTLAKPYERHPKTPKNAWNSPKRAVQGVGADQGSNPGDTQRHANNFVGRHAIIGREIVGDQNREHRRRGDQDRSQPARNSLLAPGDERGRDQVVERAHASKGGPGRRGPRHGRPLCAGQQRVSALISATLMLLRK